MDFVKVNLLKCFQDEIPVGLCALGLKKSLKKKSKQNIKTVYDKNQIYPKFFSVDRIKPIGI